jgi:hypothetical protein
VLIETAGARFATLIDAPWLLRVDVLGDRGSRAAALGSIEIAGANVGASLLHRSQRGRLALDLGGGVRGGALSLAGKPAGAGIEGRSLFAPWGGVHADACFRLWLSRGYAVDVSLESGVAFSAIRGIVGDAEGIRIGGVWGEALIGISGDPFIW